MIYMNIKTKETLLLENKKSLFSNTNIKDMAGNLMRRIENIQTTKVYGRFIQKHLQA